MGISGLLPLLKSIQRPTELKKFAGETLAVDAYGWLHRGAVSCALELAQGKPTRKYVDFAMHNVRMVKHFGATPYVVFDGDYLPSKALTEASRAKRREESKKVGMELLKAGKPSQAYLEFQKAIDVTPEMARHLIEELKKIDVPYVVAPYEADAQMVYLERHGYVSGIISEDSDLLVFGAKRLITKLDRHGQCVEVSRREFCACREISLTGWTDTEFRQMAIFSGCDYLDGIPNIGLKTAYRLLRKHKTPEKVIRTLQFEGKHRISENYLPSFRQAELTFVHQRVFCPERQELVLLTDAPPGLDVEEMPFIGAKMAPELARGIASGDINPITKELIIIDDLPMRRRAGTAYPTTAVAPIQSKLLGKPINEYFKDRRIPMGEMDANCFAVDPQQVAALTQNGLTPRVFPLPRPYLPSAAAGSSDPSRRHSAPPHTLRRRPEPIANLIGLGTPYSTTAESNRRKTTGPSTRSLDDAGLGVPASSVRPPKKARLCGEEDLGKTQLNADEPSLPALERSKFFPASSGVRTRSSRKSAPAIPMSDDSLDDALLGLPDFGSLSTAQPSKPRKSMEVFVDASPEKNGREDDADVVVSETPTKLRVAAADQDVDTVEVPASSPTQAATTTYEFDEAERAQDQRQRRRASLRSSLGKFAYTPNTGNAVAGGTRMAFGLPTPASSTVGSADSSRGPDPSSSSFSSSSDTPRLTPLQRIGANALHRGGNGAAAAAAAGSPDSTKKTMMSSSQVQVLGEVGASTGNNRRSSARRSLPPPPPVNPSFVPLPKVDLAEVEALNRPLGGSEDLIVPDSDGENDHRGDSPKARLGGSSLDLTRFLYG